MTGLNFVLLWAAVRPVGWLMVSSSDLSLDKYHAYSDATMETLLDSLENLLDNLANPEYEVEYSVRICTCCLPVMLMI